MYYGLFRYVGFYTTPKDLRSRLHVNLQGSLRDLKVDGGVSWEECEFQKAFMTWWEESKRWEKELKVEVVEIQKEENPFVYLCALPLSNLD